MKKVIPISLLIVVLLLLATCLFDSDNRWRIVVYDLFFHDTEKKEESPPSFIAISENTEHRIKALPIPAGDPISHPLINVDTESADRDLFPLSQSPSTTTGKGTSRNPVANSISTVARTRIAVIDMQSVLNKYKRTHIEVGTINLQAEKREEGSNRLERELTRIIEETKLQEKKPENAIQQSRLSALHLKRTTKQNEIESYETVTSQLLLNSRNEMEKILLTDIAAAVQQVAEFRFDLVFDKSYLPKANKLIVYQSQGVVEISSDVLQILNQETDWMKNRENE